MTVFERGEFAVRTVKARAAMAEAGVDLMLVDHAELLAWLTGYTVSETMYRALLLPRDGAPWMVLRDLDAELCRQQSVVQDIVGFVDDADPHAVIAGSIRARGFADKRIGADFQSYGFTAATRDRLAGLLPEARIIDLPRASDRLRIVKSPAELAVLGRAATIADSAMAAIGAAARPGLSPAEAGAIAAALFLRHGADSGDTGPIVRGTGDHQFLHGTMSIAPLAEGDILHVELIPKVANYSARLMRPVLIGPDRPDLTSIATRLIELQDRQIAAMKAGARARDVDALLREPVLAEGLRQSYDNVSGYALGLYGRTPRTSDFSYVFLPTAGWQLEEGMVFHMYVSAHGLAFSETVAVGAHGGRRLTQTARHILGVD